MKTIEERAKEYVSKKHIDCGNCDTCVKCPDYWTYISIAKEQKAIDDAYLLKLKSSWEKEAQINHDDEANYKQGYHDAIEKACDILSDLSVFDWMASDDPEGFSPEVHKDEFVKCLTEEN